MLNKIIVSMDERSYPIYFSTDFSHLGKSFGLSGITGKVLIITDSVVEKLYNDDVKKSLLENFSEVYSYVVPAGESSKNLENVNTIYSYLIDKKFGRDSTIVALGGGVVGDLAGFVAATFLRGINFVQIPTTLLAQVDSSVGGKVGVDFKGYKNVVGAFYQPKFVYINVNSLKTLPIREIRAGLAEVVKHGIIRSIDLFEYIEYNIDKILAMEENALMYIIRESCIIKSKIVEEDEHEDLGIRALLNFGHTIGHAVESAKEFDLLHGECVGIGMIGAFKLAKLLEIVDNQLMDRITRSFEKFGFMRSYSGVTVEQVFERLTYDKKTKSGKIFFVLPKQIGEVYYIAIENNDLIVEVLNELREENDT